MMKCIHCIIIALMLCVAGSIFAAPSDWTIVRQADWQTHFRDVTYTDAQHAWAVGDSGVIAYTSDGGQTWVAQKSGVTNNLSKVFFIDSKNGWVVGSSGTLLYTNDGGSKWQKYQFDLSLEMTDVQFFNANVGWATGNILQLLGTDGYLFTTSDGGKTWKQHRKFGMPLLDIFFLDQNIGWIAGGQVSRTDVSPASFVVQTIDGGKTWVEQKVDLRNPLNIIYFADKDNGWTFGMGGMFKTTDGGNTWVSMASTPAPGGAPGGEGAPPRRRQPSGMLSVSFSDSNIWAVNMTGNLVMLSDDGRIEPVRVPARRLTCVDFASSQVGCVAGEHGALLTTNDGGKTWISQAKVNADPLRSIAVITKDKIICLGDNNVAIQSNDGGKTWEHADIGVPGTFKYITFIDEKNGWLLGTTAPGGESRRPGAGGPPGGGENFPSGEGAPMGEGGPPPGAGEGGPPEGGFMGGGRGGSEGLILKTSDGGKTWVEKAKGPEYNVNSIVVVKPQNVFLSGANGAVFVSNDDGATWSLKDTGITWNLDDISFVDANKGWAIGMDGLSLRTTDGGESWQRSETYTVYDIKSVYFVNATKGWAVGEYGLILTTDDGGETWNSQRCYSYSQLNDVYFTDINNGWIAGNSGDIFTTKDGGKTWKKAEIPINGNFYSITKGADGAIWITGDWGVVLRSAK